jgi:hypothetical protein
MAITNKMSKKNNNKPKSNRKQNNNRKLFNKEFSRLKKKIVSNVVAVNSIKEEETYYEQNTLAVRHVSNSVDALIDGVTNLTFKKLMDVDPKSVEFDQDGYLTAIKYLNEIVNFPHFSGVEITYDHIITGRKKDKITRDIHSNVLHSQDKMSWFINPETYTDSEVRLYYFNNLLEVDVIHGNKRIPDMSSDATKILNGNCTVKDISKVLEQNDTRQINPGHTKNVKKLLRNINSGNNHIKRLVKGFLMYYYVCTENSLVGGDAMLIQLNKTVNSIVHDFENLSDLDFKTNTYIYSDNPNDLAYNNFLVMLTFGAIDYRLLHIWDTNDNTFDEKSENLFKGFNNTLTADSERIVLVGKNDPRTSNNFYQFNDSAMILNYIMRYAKSVGATSDIPYALNLTSILLQGNSYHSISIPDTVCYIDLLPNVLNPFSRDTLSYQAPDVHNMFRISHYISRAYIMMVREIRTHFISNKGTKCEGTSVTLFNNKNFREKIYCGFGKYYFKHVFNVFRFGDLLKGFNPVKRVGCPKAYYSQNDILNYYWTVDFNSECLKDGHVHHIRNSRLDEGFISIEDNVELGYSLNLITNSIEHDNIKHMQCISNEYTRGVCSSVGSTYCIVKLTNIRLSRMDDLVDHIWNDFNNFNISNYRTLDDLGFQDFKSKRNDVSIVQKNKKVSKRVICTGDFNIEDYLPADYSEDDSNKKEVKVKEEKSKAPSSSIYKKITNMKVMNITPKKKQNNNNNNISNVSNKPVTVVKNSKSIKQGGSTGYKSAEQKKKEIEEAKKKKYTRLKYNYKRALLRKPKLKGGSSNTYPICEELNDDSSDGFDDYSTEINVVYNKEKKDIKLGISQNDNFSDLINKVRKAPEFKEYLKIYVRIPSSVKTKSFIPFAICIHSCTIFIFLFL